jgi:IS605 OrfB family transposase
MNYTSSNLWSETECLTLLGKAFKDKTGVSLQTRGYRIASEAVSRLRYTNKKSKIDVPFTDIYKGFSKIVNCAQNKVMANVTGGDNLKELLKGKRTLPTFKQGVPIPFQSQVCTINTTSDGVHVLKFINGLYFKFNYGRDRSNNKIIVDNILNGKYKFCDSSIQIKDNKMSLLLCVDIPEKDGSMLDKNIVMGVDMGLVRPFYCALSNNERYSKEIGSFDTFTKMRMKKQKLYKELQSTNGGKKGKGRNKKMKHLDNFKNNERNYVRTLNHQLTKMVVDEALKNNAGVINIENLSNFKKNFAVRNWSYFEAQQMIEYKVKKYGIEVRKVNPANTSKTCHVCGHINENLTCDNKNKVMDDNRFWICPECGNKLQRDFNAAINIAKSTDYK